MLTLHTGQQGFSSTAPIESKRRGTYEMNPRKTFKIIVILEIELRFFKI